MTLSNQYPAKVYKLDKQCIVSGCCVPNVSVPCSVGADSLQALLGALDAMSAHRVIDIL